MKIFIATAMSGLSKQEYLLLQKRVLDYKDSHPQDNIFSEITNISDQDNFLSPEEATKIDINEIENCDHFVLLHLSSVQSSTLFELGIAYALNKKITIIYFAEEDLPFMLKDLNKVNKNVSLKQMSDYSELSFLLS